MMATILAPRYALSIAPRYAKCKAARCAILDMKTVEEVRRERLSILKNEAGSLVALNDKLGLNARDSTLSQILNGAKNSKTGKPKEMGSKLARDLERATGKEVGWMDTDPALLNHPFSNDAATIAADIDTLEGRDRDRVLRMCKDLIGMARNHADVGNLDHKRAGNG
jgi:hypothetical protein